MGPFSLILLHKLMHLNLINDFRILFKKLSVLFKINLRFHIIFVDLSDNFFSNKIMIQLEKNESFSNTFFIEKYFELINVFLKKLVSKKIIISYLF